MTLGSSAVPDLLTDPVGANSLVVAAHWLQALLTGSIAAAIAVLAVASVGMLALTGRIAIRRGMSVVLGCFILFGAPGIANGLIGLGRDTGGEALTVPETAAVTPPRPPAQPGYDPYAGAGVPTRQ